MPRPRKVPSYCRHKARDLAYVTIDGREVYLGRFGSPESKEKYARIIAERFPTGGANGKPLPAASASSLTVNEMILLYWHGYVEPTYVKDGKPTDRRYHVRAAMRPMKALYGSTLANEFGPRALTFVRERMVEDGIERRGGLNRKYVNEHVSIIKRMFRWAVSEELVDVSVYQALDTVGPKAQAVLMPWLLKLRSVDLSVMVGADRAVRSMTFVMSRGEQLVPSR